MHRHRRMCSHMQPHLPSHRRRRRLQADWGPLRAPRSATAASRGPLAGEAPVARLPPRLPGRSPAQISDRNERRMHASPACTRVGPALASCPGTILPRLGSGTLGARLLRGWEYCQGALCDHRPAPPASTP